MSVLYSKLLHQGRACQLHKQVTVKGCVVYQVTSVHVDKEASIICVLGLQISFSALPGADGGGGQCTYVQSLPQVFIWVET